MKRFEATDELVQREVKKRRAAKERREAAAEGRLDEVAVNEGFHRECETVRRRMAMTRRGRVLALQVSLDRTALALTKMGPEDWTRWGSYFIETIDLLLGQRHVLGEVREEFLRQVADRIADRLQHDGW